MNKSINLVKILKDCPKGTMLYSPIFGDVRLLSVSFMHLAPILVESVTDGLGHVFSSNGTLGYNSNECMLFPSRTEKDWSKWTLSANE